MKNEGMYTRDRQQRRRAGGKGKKKEKAILPRDRESSSQKKEMESRSGRHGQEVNDERLSAGESVEQEMREREIGFFFFPIRRR